MGRKGFALTTAVLGASVIAAVAAAAVINGTPGDDVLRGTDQADEIRAFAGKITSTPVTAPIWFAPGRGTTASALVTAATSRTEAGAMT